MNAAETIQAAIDKLTHLLERSNNNNSRGVWISRPARKGAVDVLVQYPDADDALDGPQEVAMDVYSDDAKLIVTLFATIDAQLDLFRQTLTFVNSMPGATSHQGPVIDLALAILGKEDADD